MVTPADIAQAMSPQTYQMLGGDEAAERALARARVWLTARLAEVGVTSISEDDPVLAQALLKYALYELYSASEQEAVALDKKQDALELLKAYVSPRVGGEHRPPVARIVPGRTP